MTKDIRYYFLILDDVLNHPVVKNKFPNVVVPTKVKNFLLPLARRGTLRDVLLFLFSKKAVEKLINGELNNIESIEPKGECYEFVNNFEDWFLYFAVSAYNMRREASKYNISRDAFIIKKIEEIYLKRVIGTVLMYHIRKAMMKTLKDYVNMKAKELRTVPELALKLSLDAKVGDLFVREALKRLDPEEVAWDVATTINVLAWLATNPARAVLLSSYFKDIIGNAWSADVVAETIGWYVWKFVGVCSKSPPNLLVIGKSLKRFDKDIRLKFIASTKEEDIIKFIEKFKKMNFPCAAINKEAKLKLATEMLKSYDDVQLILDDEMSYSISDDDKKKVIFIRPVCGKMNSFVYTSKMTKRKIIPIKKKFSKAYYAIGLKPYIEASPKEIARAAVKLSTIDILGLKEGQAEALREMILNMMLYGGVILKARTGWGKTVEASKLIENIIRHSKVLFGRDINNILFITKAALVDQAKSEIARFCPICKDRVIVMSYDKLYRAIMKYERSVHESVISFGEVISRLINDPFVPNIVNVKELKKWIREGGVNKYYEVLRDLMANSKKTFKYQFSVRAMSSDWLEALSEGELEQTSMGDVEFTENDKQIVDTLLKAEVIIFDEVHELRQMSKLRILEVNKHAIRVGLSATPQHLYNVENIELLKANIGPIVIGREEEEIKISAEREEKAEEEEELGKRVEIKMIHAPGMNTNNVNAYWEALFKGLMNDERVVEVLREAAEGKKKVLILTRYIRDVDDFASMLEQKLNYKPLVINGRTVPKNELVKYGVVNCPDNKDTSVAKCMDSGIYIGTASKLGTGWNDPKLDVIIIAVPMMVNERNINNLIQIIGRSLRFTRDKVYKEIILVCPTGHSNKRYITCDKELVEETIRKELESYNNN